MKISKGVKIIFVILTIIILIIFYKLYTSPYLRFQIKNNTRIRLNIPFFFGESDSPFCGGKGYRGNVFFRELDCCTESTCCADYQGICSWDGCFVCK